MKKTKVLFVDLFVDDNATRDAPCQVLSIFSDIKAIGSASSGREAIEKTEKLYPKLP